MSDQKARLSKLLKDTRGTESQRSFCKRLGVSLPALAGWEDGRTVPETVNLQKIAATCGKSYIELVEYLQGSKFSQQGSLDCRIDEATKLTHEDKMRMVKALIDSMAVAA
jgi:transcriptional regulator with XRE-family HTH domain